MIDILLYTTLTCSQTEAIMLRMQKHENISPEYKVELVEVMKESNPDCYWDANDWRNGGINHPNFRSNNMNTLQMVKKQVEKACALHDAQISHTSYRGVQYSTRCVESKETHGTFCYRGHTYAKW